MFFPMLPKPLYRALAATSIDGKIAKRADHFSDWTSEDKQHLRDTIAASDVIVIGNNTYKLAEDRLQKRNCIVLTSTVATIQRIHSLLTYMNPSNYPLADLINESGYKTICILGGTQIYSYCLHNNLIDELHITVEPVVFGEGLPLFNTPHESNFELTSSQQLNKRGTMLLKYTYNKKDLQWKPPGFQTFPVRSP